VRVQVCSVRVWQCRQAGVRVVCVQAGGGVVCVCVEGIDIKWRCRPVHPDSNSVQCVRGVVKCVCAVNHCLNHHHNRTNERSVGP